MTTKKRNEPITLDALPSGSVVELQGKQYPTHPGLLALAHAHGLESITTDLIQYNDGDAIIKATATGARGIYEAHGDASPANVSRNIVNAVIRMAETRAINRALRSYLGIGATTAEELPPEAMGGKSAGVKAPSRPQTRQVTPAPDDGMYNECPKCGGNVWDNIEKKTADPLWRGPWFSCRKKEECGWATWDRPVLPEDNVNDEDVPF